MIQSAYKRYMICYRSKQGEPLINDLDLPNEIFTAYTLEQAIDHFDKIMYNHRVRIVDYNIIRNERVLASVKSRGKNLTVKKYAMLKVEDDTDKWSVVHDPDKLEQKYFKFMRGNDDYNFVE